MRSKLVFLARLAVVASVVLPGHGASAQSDGKAPDAPLSWAQQAQRAIMKQVRTVRMPCKGKHCETGVATVAFVAGRAGEVNGVTIATSSGSKAVDAMAVEAVRRSAPLPPFPASEPEGVHTRQIQIKIRVN